MRFTEACDFSGESYADVWGEIKLKVPYTTTPAYITSNNSQRFTESRYTRNSCLTHLCCGIPGGESLGDAFFWKTWGY